MPRARTDPDAPTRPEAALDLIAAHDRRFEDVLILVDREKDGAFHLVVRP